MLTVTFLYSCSNGKTLDLATIDFNEDSKQYTLEKLSPSDIEFQNGHFENKYNVPLNESVLKNMSSGLSVVLVDNGEKVIKYNFDNEKALSQINYLGLPLELTMLGTQIYDYNGNISCILTEIKRDYTIDLINKLIEKIGEPNEVLCTDTPIDKVSPEIIIKLLEIFPENCKITKDYWDDEFFIYPYTVIWSADKVIYNLRITLIDTFLDNDLCIISKKALQDKVIFGYHGDDVDPTLSKYLN